MLLSVPFKTYAAPVVEQVLRLLWQKMSCAAIALLDISCGQCMQVIVVQAARNCTSSCQAASEQAVRGGTCTHNRGHRRGERHRGSSCIVEVNCWGLMTWTMITMLTADGEDGQELGELEGQICDNQNWQSKSFHAGSDTGRPLGQIYVPQHLSIRTGTLVALPNASSN